MRKALSIGLSLVGGLLAGVLSLAHVVEAHEGHDHDQPPPLNLQVAPRVVAVTPDVELVGVLSGRDRLTVFLHRFATNEPVAGAILSVSADHGSVEAKPEGDGVFTVAAPWFGTGGKMDLIFSLKLADGSEDLLTGRLEAPQSLESVPAAVKTAEAGWVGKLASDPALLWAAAGSFAVGVLSALLFVPGGRSRGADIERSHGDGKPLDLATVQASQSGPGITPLRRTASAVALAVLATATSAMDTRAAEPAQAALELPSIPSTMATDQPQRMPDATLFVPKATQHLLSIRTQRVERVKAARAIEMTGRVTVGPQNLGRVQSSRPGRFIAAGELVGFVGMKVKPGQVLGHVETYIEAADRANIASQIAETEARIAKNRIILSRYEKSPGAVPQVTVDEVRGELEALTKRREELLPSTSAREPLMAPIGGVISAAKVVVGQVVESSDVLFEIIDPSEFWIEAVAPHVEDINDVAAAVATVHDHHTLDLEYLGRGLALRNHSTVLNFKVLTPGEALAVGMTARVILKLAQETEGFILPTSAVVRGPTGLPIVWLKISPERFEPQVVKVEPFDGDNVRVVAGLEADQRVVTDGVTLLNQIR
ncbi:MAG: HlyD family efflux transporter periplasmic adaptor subunit [Hyphomicrobiaceae bacterium]|nr:HlyD family efflux transporter periplasmic adaptor subunit [Hyphomicrobiaceae bacterium]